MLKIAAPPFLMELSMKVTFSTGWAVFWDKGEETF
jgi:hypothetical protein